MAKKAKPRYIWRDAGTGKILTVAAAKERNPATVVRERVGKK